MKWTEAGSPSTYANANANALRTLVGTLVGPPGAESGPLHEILYKTQQTVGGSERSGNQTPDFEPGVGDTRPLGRDHGKGLQA